MTVKINGKAYQIEDRYTKEHQSNKSHGGYDRYTEDMRYTGK